MDTYFERVITFPYDIAQTKRQFGEIAGFPAIVACAIDGSHVSCDGPHNFEHQFVNRHGGHSVNISAGCGPDYKIYWFTANWPGSVHDSRVLRESILWRRMQAGNLLPPNSIFLVDSAYAASVSLLF